MPFQYLQLLLGGSSMGSTIAPMDLVNAAVAPILPVAARNFHRGITHTHYFDYGIGVICKRLYFDVQVNARQLFGLLLRFILSGRVAYD